MAEEERDCSLNFALLVYKVDVQYAEAIDLYLCFVIGKLVDVCFMLSPVVTVLPVLRQVLDISQGGSIIPSSFFKLVREDGG